MVEEYMAKFFYITFVLGNLEKVCEIYNFMF